jgi:hypothetical protein
MKPSQLARAYRRIALCLALALMAPTLAWGLGADLPSTAVTNGKWPKGLAELVNTPARVHGYFVNAADVLFFAGDAPALNAFLTKYAQLPNTKFKVILHPGKPEVKSPWDEQPREIVADWKLYAAPYDEAGLRPQAGEFVTRVDVWLGGAVKWDELRMPANVPVESFDQVARVAPSTRPSANYRLTRQTVAGLTPMQWAFIIVTPEGYPWVSTEDELRSTIEKAVPTQATLEWAPGCKRVGGEPLETVEELESLKAFCTVRGVKFVHSLGG